MKAGEYKIQWKHNNNTALKGTKSSTQCNILKQDNSLVATGLTICSEKDHYNRKLGRKLSFSRAVAKIEDRSVRTDLWAKFKEESPKCINCH